MDDNQIQVCLEKAQRWQQTVNATFEEMLLDEPLKNIHVQKRMRVKSKASLANKITKKKAEKPYALTDVTDIVGFRFVCHFQKEVEMVVDTILAKAQRKDDHDFEKLLEARVYVSPAPNQQALLEGLKVVFARHGLPTETEVKASNYTSVHLVIQKKQGQVFEVQIRNVFEDAWSEIEHALKYKIEKGVLSPSVGKHLKTLNTFTQACSEYSENILFDYDDGLRSGAPQVRELEDEEELKTLPQDVYKVIKDSQSLRHSGKFKDGIDLLTEFIDKNAERLAPGTDLQYFVVMERSLCHLLDGRTQAAITDYSTLLKTHPDRGLIYLRLGDAYRVDKDFREAVRYLELIPSKLNGGKNTAKEVELLEAYPFMLAHVYWRMKEPCLAVKILDEALENGILKIQTDGDELRFTNCYAYYKIDCAQKLGVQVPISELKVFYEKLSRLGISNGRYWNELDTYLLICERLGKTQEAKLCAEMLNKAISYPVEGEGPKIVLVGGTVKEVPLEEIEVVRAHIDRVQKMPS
jgi:ppGpp synthetase/RelA/SpoT-type nucleotidyltranferase